MMKKLSPGFRFHPTDEELVMYFLKRKVLGKRLVAEVIAEVNIYDFSPWDLPDMSKLKYGDLEWFFFCPKSRKYSSGSRTNRATETGYWKATGKDREVKYKDKIVAAIKTLVFHLGHSPKGTRTDWVLHEYRMDDKDLANAGVIQDTYVLCRLFEKSGLGPKNGAQYGAPFEEEEWDNMDENEVISFESSAMITTDTFNSNAAVTNMTLTEPAPSTVTSSDSERLVVQVGSKKTLYSDASNSVVTNMTTTEPGLSIVTSDNERLVQFGATKTLNSNASSSGVTNMTLTEPAPSTVTSDSERLVVQVGSKKTLYSDASNSVVTNMTTTEPGLSIVTSDNERLIQFGATKTLNSNASSSGVTNMTSTEAGPSTITFPENETHLYTAANDDVLLDHEWTDSILQITNTLVVEDCNGENVITDAPNGDDLIYLDDLSLDGFDIFPAEGSAGFDADAFFADDLDDVLAGFRVDKI